MKPEWVSAPDWANWLAQDENGDWFWHKSKPVERSHEWFSSKVVELAQIGSETWRESLEEKPKI